MPSILIADDNRQITFDFGGIRQKRGLHAADALDGQQAVDLFLKHRPDVVLLDVIDAQNGRLRGVPGVPQDSNTPVIMVTAGVRTLRRSWASTSARMITSSSPFPPAR
jgi:CheY-like chemotaxis protein